MHAHPRLRFLGLARLVVVTHKRHLSALSPTLFSHTHMHRCVTNIGFIVTTHNMDLSCDHVPSRGLLGPLLEFSAGAGISENGKASPRHCSDGAAHARRYGTEDCRTRYGLWLRDSVVSGGLQCCPCSTDVWCKTRRLCCVILKSPSCIPHGSTPCDPTKNTALRHPGTLRSRGCFPRMFSTADSHRYFLLLFLCL